MVSREFASCMIWMLFGGLLFVFCNCLGCKHIPGDSIYRLSLRFQFEHQWLNIIFVTLFLSSTVRIQDYYIHFPTIILIDGDPAYFSVDCMNWQIREEYQ